MIVDSSALTEQVVMDVISSAFDSAGQRCSALRVLCVQDDVADRVIRMLRAPWPSTRSAAPSTLHRHRPVIDTEAKTNIERHIKAMGDKGARCTRSPHRGDACSRGTFVLPTLIELDSLDELGREVFGPVLHLVRYPRTRLGSCSADQRQRLRPDPACSYPHRRDHRPGGERGQGGQPLRQPQHRGRRGRGATLRWGRAFRHRSQAGGPLYMYRLLGARPQEAVANQLHQESGALHAEAKAPS